MQLSAANNQIASCPINSLRWYEKYSYSQRVSKTLFATSIGTTAFTVGLGIMGGLTGAVAIPIMAFATVTGSLIGSYYLRVKEYMKDPQYRNKICNKIKNQNIHVSLKKYDWVKIQDLLSHEEIKKLVYQQIHTYSSFAALWSREDINFIRTIFQNKYMDKEFIESRIDYDCKFNNTANIQEYSKYINLISAVFDHVELYKKINDDKLDSLSFDQLWNCHMETMYDKKLLNFEFVREKLLIIMQTKSFRDLDNYIEWALSHDIIKPNEIAMLFRQEYTNTNSIINFLDKYWNRYLEVYKYNIGLASFEYDNLKKLNDQYSLIKKFKNNLYCVIQNKYSVQISKIQNEYDRKISDRKLEQKKIELQNERNKLEQEKLTHAKNKLLVKKNKSEIEGNVIVSVFETIHHAYEHKQYLDDVKKLEKERNNLFDEIENEKYIELKKLNIIYDEYLTYVETNYKLCMTNQTMGELKYDRFNNQIDYIEPVSIETNNSNVVHIHQYSAPLYPHISSIDSSSNDFVNIFPRAVYPQNIILNNEPSAPN